MRKTDWRIWNTGAYLIMVALNWLANVIPIGGRTTGEVSGLFPVLATPASYAFTIWILIYGLLGGFVLLQWQPGWRDQPIFRRIGPWFVVSCFFNFAWLLLWHTLHIRSSVFAMLALLLTLVQLYGLTRAAKDAPRGSGLVVRWFVRLPFSLYAGWITAASAVNVLVGFEVAGWNDGGLEPLWTFLLLLAVAAAALLVYLRRQDAAYTLVIAWALAAIGVEQQDAVPLLAWTAWLLAAGLTICALWIVPKKGRRTR
ncbi:hypothetical protein MO973_26500 [Paenibacillus sp. TRM 82003]|nr:hypothetical protein [Paenibacillus sp. TRM 82003]